MLFKEKPVQRENFCTGFLWIRTKIQIDLSAQMDPSHGSKQGRDQTSMINVSS